MKKFKLFFKRPPIVYIGIMAVVAVLIFAMCKKEQILGNQTTAPVPPNQAVASRCGSCGNVSMWNDMLSFPDMDMFVAVYDELEEASANADDPYPDTDDNLDNEPFIDDDIVLQEFEQSLGFNSLRAIWLLIEHAALEEGNDPENLPEAPFTDDVLMAMLNGQHLVRIGDQIYWFQNEDVIYLISVESYGQIDEIINSGKPLEYSGVEVLNGVEGTRGACNADFYFQSPGSALTYQFIYSGSPTAGVQYKWSFGDGSTSTDANPTHTYASQGPYTVCLTIVTDSCTDQKCVNLQVGALCFPLFTMSETGVKCETQFIDRSFTLGGNITSWEWQFSGGTPATFTGQFPPPVTFVCNGEREISLKITTSSGCTQTISRSVKITSCECCKKKDKVKGNKTYNNGKNQIFWKQKQNHFPRRVVKAKMIHYKKKNNGKWKKSRAELFVELKGKVYGVSESSCSCEIPIPIEAERSKTARKCKARKVVGEKYDGKLDDKWEAYFTANGILVHSSTLPKGCD